MSVTGVERATSDWGNVEQLGRHHLSTLPPYWLSRIYLALGVLTPILVIWWEPETLTHKLIARSGQQGWILVWLLAGVACLAIFDVIVNDLMSDRYQMPFAKRNRHFVYIALSIGVFCMTYVFIAEGGGLRPLVLPFWVDGIAAATLAFVDLFERHRGHQ